MTASTVEGWKDGKMVPRLGVPYPMPRIADQLIMRDAVFFLALATLPTDVLGFQEVFDASSPEKRGIWVEDGHGNTILQPWRF